MVQDDRRGMDLARDTLDFWASNVLRVGMLSNPDLDSQGGDSKASAKDDKGQNSPITVGEVFVIHELGLGNMPDDPPRSSLAATMDNDSDQIEERMALVTDGALQGKLKPDDAMRFLGEEVIELVKQRIKNHIPPELSDERKKQKVRSGKRGDTPLVNFGQLINSFRYQITKD